MIHTPPNIADAKATDEAAPIGGVLTAVFGEDFLVEFAGVPADMTGLLAELDEE